VITLEDCVAFCGVTEEEVLAIAEHEHMPAVSAAALTRYLLSLDHGSDNVRDMIIDDIRQAQRNDDKEHVLILLHVLHHFLRRHPEAIPARHPWMESSSESLREREIRMRALAHRMEFTVEEIGGRFTLVRSADVPRTVRHENLTLSEAEELLEAWKLRGGG
jgi:hypothetical protein